MKFSGFEGVDLVNYPGRVCSVLYTPGCNFRCPYCYNPKLVRTRKGNLDEDKTISEIKKREKLVDSVCITGGEPLIHAELPSFVQRLKKHKLLVKLDTNGSNPEELKRLLDGKLLDYVAMDIKGPLEDYPKITGFKDTNKIQESINLLQGAGIPYEFRTTLVPDFFDKEKAKQIGELLKGSRLYVMQQFLPKTTLDNRFENKKPYERKEFKEFEVLMAPYFKSVRVKGF